VNPAVVAELSLDGVPERVGGLAPVQLLESVEVLAPVRRVPGQGLLGPPRERGEAQLGIDRRVQAVVEPSSRRTRSSSRNEATPGWSSPWASMQARATSPAKSRPQWSAGETPD